MVSNWSDPVTLSLTEIFEGRREDASATRGVAAWVYVITAVLTILVLVGLFMVFVWVYKRYRFHRAIKSVRII